MPVGSATVPPCSKGGNQASRSSRLVASAASQAQLRQQAQGHGASGGRAADGYLQVVGDQQPAAGDQAAVGVPGLRRGGQQQRQIGAAPGDAARQIAVGGDLARQRAAGADAGALAVQADFDRGGTVGASAAHPARHAPWAAHHRGQPGGRQGGGGAARRHLAGDAGDRQPTDPQRAVLHPRVQPGWWWRAAQGEPGEWPGQADVRVLQHEVLRLDASGQQCAQPDAHSQLADGGAVADVGDGDVAGPQGCLRQQR